LSLTTFLLSKTFAFFFKEFLQKIAVVLFVDFDTILSRGALLLEQKEEEEEEEGEEEEVVEEEI
jgi:hypothetical protein